MSVINAMALQEADHLGDKSLSIDIDEDLHFAHESECRDLPARDKLCCRAASFDGGARGGRKKDEPAKTAKVHSVVDRVPPALTPLQPSVLEALRSEYKLRAMPHSFFEVSGR
ncbi:hypothetical protein FOZ63_006239 [Perkinsus olseni]|uniref:Uncharacterized protein n=1 Tax=Perkinsus olseni TaxID=32597 RepID=A0A7J6SWL6_PEROL|nr:hypothetical protein FOZ63_006239 [Perkinsus olseni]KAF4754421.1 hypothetical protein FOZ62_007914 [Perkinsus olseni]